MTTRTQEAAARLRVLGRAPKTDLEVDLQVLARTPEREREQRIRELWETHAPGRWVDRCPHFVVSPRNAARDPWPAALSPAQLGWVLRNVATIESAQALLKEAVARETTLQAKLGSGRDACWPLDTIGWMMPGKNLKTVVPISAPPWWSFRTLVRKVLIEVEDWQDMEGGALRNVQVVDFVRPGLPENGMVPVDVKTLQTMRDRMRTALSKSVLPELKRLRKQQPPPDYARLWDALVKADGSLKNPIEPLYDLAKQHGILTHALPRPRSAGAALVYFPALHPKP